MRERAPFESLRLELTRGGVAPVYIERTLLELRDHLEDLERAARTAGLDAQEAAAEACAQLGSESTIAAAVLARPELLSWRRRWPTLALCARCAAAVGTLPGMPFVYCAHRGDELARWGAALCGALLLVGALLACLDWMIMLPPEIRLQAITISR